MFKKFKWLALLAGGAAGVWSLFRSQRPPTASALGGRDPVAAADLLKAIPGNDKTAIAAVFGPPRASAGFSSMAPAMLVSADYLQADTWYYPLDNEAQTALVVRFAHNIAHDAQLVCMSDLSNA